VLSSRLNKIYPDYFQMNMENQNFEKSCFVFLDQFKNLLQNNMFAEASALAEERLTSLSMDADAYVAVDKTLIVTELIQESLWTLRDLENEILALPMAGKYS
jgi:hypothetical protein